MKLIKEFKEFAVKGNMMDIAIGVIIGASFNKVIDVLVKQVMMPPLSMLTNGINFSEKRIILNEAIIENGVEISKEVAIGYGLFVETMIDFTIIAATVFLVVRAMNRLKRRAQNPKDATVETPKDIELLTRISDLIEDQNKFLKQQQKSSN